MDKKGKFILLRDLEDPSSQGASLLWGMLSSYVYGNQPPVALKGELFESLPADEQPVELQDRIALRGLKQKYLTVECTKDDIKCITDLEAHTLLAVQSYTERCRMLGEKKALLSQGVTLEEGSRLFVRVDDLNKDVAAVVRYKGALPPYDGIMFGIEITDPRFCNRGTTDGVFRCQRYFRCPPGAGMFVSLDKLSFPDDDLDGNVAEKSVQLDQEASLHEDKPNEEDSGLESSQHSTLEVELLHEKAGLSSVEDDGTNRSIKDGEDEEYSSVENEGEDDPAKDELEEDGEQQQKEAYVKQTKLLHETQHRLKESKLRINSLERRLDEELAIREELGVEVNVLKTALSEELIKRKEVESELEEAWNKIRKQQKAFEREWEEFERRLLEEHATKSDIEQQLDNSNRLIQEERSLKNALQRQLETLQKNFDRQQEEFERQREHLEAAAMYNTTYGVEATHGVESPAELESRDWIISRDEVEVSVETNLGSGGWGSVKEGRFRGCKVAVKQIHELILSPHNRRLFEREMSIASRCRHPCLLQFIGATNDDGIPMFVTELLDISLRGLLEKQSLRKTDSVSIALDVSRALNYLHLNRPFPIIHRDISSANVLLWRRDDRWRAKVSDYGAANFMRQCRTINPGAVIYSAPEAFSSEQSPKIDVYSFGLLLCEMCIRELPVPHQTQEQISMVTDHVIKDVIQRCVQQEPEARPSMAEVVKEFEKMEGKDKELKAD